MNELTESANLAVEKTREAQEAIEASRLSQTDAANKKLEELIVLNTIETKKNALEIVLKAEAVAKSFIEIAEQSAKRLHERKPDWFQEHEKDDDRRFGQILESNKAQTVLLNEIKLTAQPINEWFSHMTWDKKSRMALLKTISIVTGVFLGIAAAIGVVWGIIKYVIINAIK